MKMRITVAGLAMLLVVSFLITGMGFAQGSQSGGPDQDTLFQQKLGTAKAHNVQGTVLSHDVKCHCVVLKTGKGNLTLQDDYAKFEGDYDRAKGLKTGSKISGTYKTVDYINYAVDLMQD